MKSLETKFLEEIARIKEPEIFIGVARILKTKLFDEEKKEVSEFEDILRDCMEKFKGSSRKRKKELLWILGKANKAPAIPDTNAAPISSPASSPASKAPVPQSNSTNPLQEGEVNAN